jgi:antirestriction protein ArdC
MADTTRTDKLASAHADLVAAVGSLTTGDDWKRMLETASRFTQYSANNLFLIMLQRPDATRVAGYRTWQGLGRQVRKGEKGIRILAPCKFRRTETADDGTEAVRVGISGFTTAAVFDISQTDGEPVPDVRPQLLVGEGPAGLWEAVSERITAAGYTIERVGAADLGGANGCTNPASRIVTIREDVSPAQATKTLAHELAHIELGHVTDLTGYATCRGRCEVEAESVAYLICQAAGMASDGYTWHYIARWADGDAEVVRQTADRVVKASRAILDGLEVPELLEAAA